MWAPHVWTLVWTLVCRFSRSRSSFHSPCSTQKKERKSPRTSSSTPTGTCTRWRWWSVKTYIHKYRIRTLRLSDYRSAYSWPVDWDWDDWNHCISKLNLQHCNLVSTLVDLYIYFGRNWYQSQSWSLFPGESLPLKSHDSDCHSDRKSDAALK